MYRQEFADGFIKLTQTPFSTDCMLPVDYFFVAAVGFTILMSIIGIFVNTLGQNIFVQSHYTGRAAIFAPRVAPQNLRPPTN